MKIKIFLSFFAFSFTISLFAQNHQSSLSDCTLPEVYLAVEPLTQNEIKELAHQFSIDRVDYNDELHNYKAVIWLNRKDYADFQALNIPYEIIHSESDKAGRTMANTIDQMASWNRYPTYSVYLEMMANFQNQFPNLCRIDTLLTATPNQHAILAAHISNHLDEPEDKPSFLYTSSIHGDEVTGFIMMLQLIDYLLNNYETDSLAMTIIDNVKLWICPLENPDGTYYSGDNVIDLSPVSVRSNWNGIDLNRAYPTIPNHTTPATIEPEIQAMINFVNQHNFTMSANFHGGAEVFNFPWDKWSSSFNAHADHNWWYYIGRQFTDTIHLYSPYDYFTYLDNGVTQGADWYAVEGCRQDYMNYFAQCREVTIEISDSKTPRTNNLPSFWDYLHHSLLNFITESLYGIRGIVTDSLTGEPIYAQVFINNHDHDSSFVFTSLPIGNYHRPILEGSYSVTYSSEGYIPKTFTINTINNQATYQNVALSKIVNIHDYPDNEISINPNPTSGIISLNLHNLPLNNIHCLIYNVAGEAISNQQITQNITSINLSTFPTGIYFIKVLSNNQELKTLKVVKN